MSNQPARFCTGVSGQSAGSLLYLYDNKHVTCRPAWVQGEDGPSGLEKRWRLWKSITNMCPYASRNCSPSHNSVNLPLRRLFSMDSAVHCLVGGVSTKDLAEASPLICCSTKIFPAMLIAIARVKYCPDVAGTKVFMSVT